MNCLTYLLHLLSEGHKFKIFYNGEHCIGVNGKKLFDFGNKFKEELLNGKNNTLKYFQITEYHPIEGLISAFNIKDELQLKLIENYYNKN